MRDGTPHILSLKRTLSMFEAVITDGGRSSVSELAREIGMPIATAHRQVTTLVAEGYLSPVGGGRHVAGSRLLGLLHRLDEKQVVANVAAPLLHHLAARVRSVVQLGTFENDMVTYRIKTGRGAADLFTRVGMQLEAYCSGIGKVLLAHLPKGEQEAYLSGGPFVALTERTIVDPDRLRQELDVVFEQGYAIDNNEIAHGLRCMAVPLCKSDGTMLAAISVSQAGGVKRRISDGKLLRLLRETAQCIEQSAFGQSRSP
ncbi:MAG: IclR family transcriptional regulator [Alphaproteobacteria bacterium HGW-Alphaproteobacteria-7]|jgi:DNA-binding IclR family transcriptional regulator|nr:MAG: IclR family transcriptional regulator [Alphaproteobacteria bacterium HGW-Alphaproteobacteria-7]